MDFTKCSQEKFDWFEIFLKICFHLLTARKFSSRLNTQLLNKRILFTYSIFLSCNQEAREAEGRQAAW